MRNLHHTDRARAKEQADEAQAEIVLRLGAAGPAARLGGILDAFVARQEEREGELHPESVKEAGRHGVFWKAMLGTDTDPNLLTQDDIDTRCACGEAAR